MHIGGLVLYPKEFLSGIHCGGHLAIMYGGDLLYLQIFFIAKLVEQG